MSDPTRSIAAATRHEVPAAYRSAEAQPPDRVPATPCVGCWHDAHWGACVECRRYCVRWQVRRLLPRDEFWRTTLARAIVFAAYLAFRAQLVGRLSWRYAAIAGLVWTTMRVPFWLASRAERA